MTSRDTKNHIWPMDAHYFGGVPIIATTDTEAAHQLSRMAVDRATVGRHVHLVNAYTLALADGDRDYASLLSVDSINLPDGKPISIVSQLMRHTPRLRQIRGPKLFLDMFDVGRTYGVRHYLLGSSPEVLKKLQESLTLRYPGAEIVGLESPPYRSLTDTEISAQDQRVIQARPDIVWVGLGTPKQDKEAARITQSTDITTIAVGAAFDFAAGEVREAPKWMTTMCLEWLFRLISEPRRLWRRYFFGNIKFLQIVWRCMMSRELSSHGRR